jgi:hypothetical protein
VGTVLVFEVVFIADDDRLDLVMRVVLDLKKPLVKVLETITLGEIED